MPGCRCTSNVEQNRLAVAQGSAPHPAAFHMRSPEELKMHTAGLKFLYGVTLGSLTHGRSRSRTGQRDWPGTRR